MRWLMQATKAPARRQRTSRVIAAPQLIATTFVMHAMVERYARQLKMPSLDAYSVQGCGPASTYFPQLTARQGGRHRCGFGLHGQYSPHVMRRLTHIECPRRPNFDHPCRLNIDQEWKAARRAAFCG